jgi:hypothetical protein
MTMSEVANAFESIMNPKPQAETPAPAQAAPQDSPQEAAPEAADTGNTEADQVEPDTSETTAPEPIPEPAKQAPSISPEMETRLKEADRKAQEADTARNQYINQLNTIIPHLEAAIKGEFADIKTKDDLYALADPRSPQYNVERYNAAIIAFSKLNDATQARDQAAQEQLKQHNEKMQAWRAAEQEKVGKLIPELNDPNKGPALARKLQDFATKQGYTAQQLGNASAADFALLHRAMQFDDLQAAKAAAQAKAAKAPPVQAPGVQRPNAGKEDKIRSDFERLKKTGRVDDAAAVFRHLLN